MNKINKSEHSFKKILKIIAAKRFSKNESIVLIVVIIVLLLAGNHFVQVWIEAQKNQTNVIAPIIPPDKLVLPKPILKKTKGDKKEVLDIAPKKPAIRDPFLSSKDPEKFEKEVQKKPQIDLNLSGILWDDQIPTAIINSKVVKIGDLVFGKTVVDIEKDQVVLMEEGQMFVLKLRKR
jgi:hypothetical protein